MFFKKCDRGHGATFALAVSALAVVGAMSITKCGNQMIRSAKKKVCDIFNKEKNMCENLMEKSSEN